MGKRKTTYEPKQGREYNFPYSVRPCYVCMELRVFKYSKTLNHSICLKCECPGISKDERETLGIEPIENPWNQKGGADEE